MITAFCFFRVTERRSALAFLQLNAPIAEAEKFYRHVINMRGPGKGFINCVSPRDFEELTLMISFPLICARKEAPA